jgi:hypothetical protein
MSLFNWDEKKKQPIMRPKRIGEGDTEFVEIKMLQRAWYDGLEEYPGDRSKLLPGITYSVPRSLADLLIEQGKAEKAEK